MTRQDYDTARDAFWAMPNPFADEPQRCFALAWLAYRYAYPRGDRPAHLPRPAAFGCSPIEAAFAIVRAAELVPGLQARYYEEAE